MEISVKKSHTSLHTLELQVLVLFLGPDSKGYIWLGKEMKFEWLGKEENIPHIAFALTKRLPFNYFLPASDVTRKHRSNVSHQSTTLRFFTLHPSPFTIILSLKSTIMFISPRLKISQGFSSLQSSSQPCAIQTSNPQDSSRKKLNVSKSSLKSQEIKPSTWFFFLPTLFCTRFPCYSFYLMLLLLLCIYLFIFVEMI